MSRSVITATFAVAVLAALGGGCESHNNSPDAASANASESMSYTAGTGVSSSSFERHPRFYTGPNGDPPSARSTQPASAQ